MIGCPEQQMKANRKRTLRTLNASSIKIFKFTAFMEIRPVGSLLL